MSSKITGSVTGGNRMPSLRRLLIHVAEAAATADGRRSKVRPRIAILIVTASLALIACQSGPGTLTISQPTGGAVINAETTVVQGTAPANTEVIHDVPGGFDARTLSDAAGAWDMEVELEVGDNVLTFRLAEDPFEDTEQ